MRLRLLVWMFAVFGLATACGDDPASSTKNNGDPPVADVGVDTAPDDTPDTSANNGEADTGTDPTSCTSDADCEAPQVCLIDTRTGDRVCGDPVGDKQAGESCSDGSECASGLCLNGACAAPCGGDEDCPNGYACEASEVPLEDGSTATIEICVAQPEPCLSNEDCTDPQICVVDRSGDEPVLECGAPVGGGQLGDACTDDADCASNLCIEQTCSAPCERPIDCATDGSYRCESVDVTDNTSLNVCRPRPAEQCLSDADCTSPERCVASKTATELEFVCGTPNAGGGETGDACTADADCAQNLCTNGTCAGPCESNGDCAQAADYSCEVTDVDLGNGNTDDASICVAPETCTDKDECRVGDVCYVRRQNMDADTICRSPNVGGGELGQVCGSDRECAANYCLPTRFRDVCTQPCNDDMDCPTAGYSCGQVEVTLPGGGTDTLQVCTPETPTPCTSQDDCATGTTCSIIENAAGTALEAVCVPRTGGDATGVACNVDDDCASLVCLDGHCAAPCVDDNQCSSEQLCLQNTVTKNMLSGTFDVCETLADQTCNSSDECSDGVRVCGELRDVGGTITPYCTFPNAGGSQLGTQCTMGSECRENICLTGISNECSVVCNKDADCGMNQGCTSFGDIGFCNTVCADNGECAAAGNICTINSDPPRNEVDQICHQPIGTGELGADCASGSECRTGLCLDMYVYDGTSCTADSDCDAGETCECPIENPNCTTGKECATLEQKCTRLCDDGGDCTGGAPDNDLTQCSPDIWVRRPDGSAKQISTCARP